MHIHFEDKYLFEGKEKESITNHESLLSHQFFGFV